MSATVEARSHLTSDPARARRERRRCTGGDRHTLEERLSSVWEGLFAAGVAECPLCRSRMERHGAGGRCTSCGTTLQ